MRPSHPRLFSALVCCALVAVTARVAPAQGIVVVRPSPCAPPPRCDPGACVLPRCAPIAPLVIRNSSRVHVELADRVLRYEVTETFVNRGSRLGEADYLFPLPAGAAFQDLKLSINGELVAGEVLDAGQARGVYEDIVRRQRDPGLVEWMGAGLLRARIFPIAPGDEKTVVVRFQSVARREGDAIRVDYRHAGAGCRELTVACPSTVSAGPSVARSDVGPDVGPGDDRAESREEFSLTYKASDGFGTPYSPTQALINDRDGNERTIRIEGDAPDITILLPMPHATAAAVTMLPYAPGDGPGFALITVSPPVVHAAATPRDVTFVLDVSGSMSGRKIEQARAAGRDLLATLTPQDRFRLIDFSTDVRTFRDDYERATPEHVREAEQYLDELEADGATNIEGALRRALEPPPEDGDSVGTLATTRLPIVLFITDGEPTIGEQSPDALVAEATSHLGHTRLFTFGLGADVNALLLEQLALQGRGTSQFVRPDESVERAVSLVAHCLTDPVITDLALRTDGVRLNEMLPEAMTDLFAGQDLVLLARYDGSGPAHLRFSGRTATGPVSWTSDVVFPDRERANPFVARLWATQRIGYLEAARHKSGPSSELDTELRSLGERFGIPTELTSYLVREPVVANVALPAAGQFGMQGGPTISGPTVENALQGKATVDSKKDALRLEAQVVTGVATQRAGSMAAPSPTAAFAQAKAAAAQRAATTLAAADSTAALAVGAGDARSDAVQHAGDRTLMPHDGVWIDTWFHAGMRVVRVQPFSAAYFALIQAVPDVRSAFAIGEHVIVAGHTVAIEVTPEGVAQLSDSDVAAVQRAW